MTERRRRTSRSPRKRLLGGYAPLAIGGAMAVAAIAFVPSTVPAELAGADGGSAAEVPVGETASGWGTTVTPCADRPKQVADAGYSPPCFEFNGDNGGATTDGVTGETIKVAYRTTAEGNVLGLFAQLSGMPINESSDDLTRTAEGLIEYFNESAWPWIVGMSYKAVRTERAKLVHWVHQEGVDELYDLEKDPYEIENRIGDAAYGKLKDSLTRELRKLVAESVGL